MENKFNRVYSRDEQTNEREEYPCEYSCYRERTDFARRFPSLERRQCEEYPREYPCYRERTTFARRSSPERRQCEEYPREYPCYRERTNFARRFSPERRQCEEYAREYPCYRERTNFARRFSPECRQRDCYHNDERKDTKFRLYRELPEFRPEEVKVKLDPVYHTLTLKAKRVNQPYQTEQDKCFVRKEVIPLPENIKLEELRVKFSPRGDLLVKAPYQKREEGTYSQQHYKRHGEIPLQISYKDIRGKRREEEMLPTGQVDTNKCSVQQYLRLLKNSTFPNTLSTECIRDEKTGKWMIIFDVNTVGFRREEIQIDFQEKERLLIVEAKHEMRRENEFQGISVKTLHREFFLPEYIDGKQMRYRILNTGVLRIQVPCLRNPYPKTYDQDEETEQFRLRFF